MRKKRKKKKGWIPFLKDALDLRPEAEAVQELLEGLPGEIIRFNSLRLPENSVFRKKEKKKR